MAQDPLRLLLQHLRQRWTDGQSVKRLTAFAPDPQKDILHIRELRLDSHPVSLGNHQRIQHPGIRKLRFQQILRRFRQTFRKLHRLEKRRKRNACVAKPAANRLRPVFSQRLNVLFRQKLLQLVLLVCQFPLQQKILMLQLQLFFFQTGSNAIPDFFHNGSDLLAVCIPFEGRNLMFNLQHHIAVQLQHFKLSVSLVICLNQLLPALVCRLRCRFHTGVRQAFFLLLLLQIFCCRIIFFVAVVLLPEDADPFADGRLSFFQGRADYFTIRALFRLHLPDHCFMHRQTGRFLQLIQFPSFFGQAISVQIPGLGDIS